MGNTENLFAMVQPQSDYPEIIQFFEMLTLPRAIFGYDKRQVIDALRCLDGLYQYRIAELEEKNQRNQKFRQSQIEQKESAISNLEKQVEKERIISWNSPCAEAAASYGRIDVLSEVIPEIQQSLHFVIRKAASEAKEIVENAHRQADKILEENRRKMEQEHARHKRALEKMSELKKQYLIDLNALQMILDGMKAEAANFKKRLEGIQEKPVMKQAREEMTWAAGWQ